MPKNESLALARLESRWREIFSALAEGGEVPPGRRLRTEGYMEAVVELGLADERRLQDAMAACYRDCYGEMLQEDWRDLFPFPQVPGFGQRAPVFPSTSD